MFDVSRELGSSVALYSRKVLIQTKAMDILPKWLRFVRGTAAAPRLYGVDSELSVTVICPVQPTAFAFAVSQTILPSCIHHGATRRAAQCLWETAWCIPG